MTATAALGVVAVLALVLLAIGVVNPFIPLIVFALAALPLAAKLLGSMFEHAAPSPAERGSSPAVPSTREASYDPVADPTERG
jgi:hypothetical protein